MRQLYKIYLRMLAMERHRCCHYMIMYALTSVSGENEGYICILVSGGPGH